MRRGWELTKKSWALLRENKGLLRFPIYGALAAIVPVVLVVFPGLYLIDTEKTLPGAVLVALGLYLAAFAATYFSVALAGAVDALLQGRPNPDAEGYAVASSRRGAIAGWALLSAIMGTIFSLLESQDGLAQIAGYLFGAAWSLVTFLAVPVIAIEGTGPITTVRRSTKLFRSRWQGQITGNIAIGGLVGLLGILPSIILIAIGVYLWINDPNGSEVAVGAVLVAIGSVVLVAASMILRALRGVFGVALYRFAEGGQVAGPFTAEELNSAVRTR